jgi:1,4-dihydroxy-2-naphthoyl-CoA hydrolase
MPSSRPDEPRRALVPEPPERTPRSPSLGMPLGGVHELLGAELHELSPERVVMSVPVTGRVHQLFGVLHGGVSALLAESAASIGGAISVAPDRRVVGIEINASHLRSLREGTLVATATPVRKGRTIQVWEIRLTDEGGRAICQARCTLAVTEPGAGPTEPATEGTDAPPRGA